MRIIGDSGPGPGLTTASLTRSIRVYCHHSCMLEAASMPISREQDPDDTRACRIPGGSYTCAQPLPGRPSHAGSEHMLRPFSADCRWKWPSTETQK